MKIKQQHFIKLQFYRAHYCSNKRTRTVIHTSSHYLIATTNYLYKYLQMERMDKSLESVQRNFSTVRTGRANPSMLDRIEVDYYGASTPLKQIAGVSTPEATLLVIQPYDQTAIPAIERAIQHSDIGLTPNNDGKVIRLQVPQLTAVSRSIIIFRYSMFMINREKEK